MGIKRFLIIFLVLIFLKDASSIRNPFKAGHARTMEEEDGKNALIEYVPEYSISSPFNNVRHRFGDWEMHGSAMLSEDNIRLTSDLKNRVGWLSGTKRVSYPSWRVEMILSIGGGGRYGADGLAFWYTAQPLKEGVVFGGNDRWDGMIIAIDTFDNDGKGDNPTIGIAFNEGMSSFDVSEDGKNLIEESCSNVRLRNTAEPFMLSVQYAEKTVIVEYKFDSSKDWKFCFQKDNVNLPVGYFFGISAATGQLFDNHDIYSLKTYVNPNSKNFLQPPEQKQEEEEEEEEEEIEIETEEKVKDFNNNYNGLDEKMRYLETLQKKLRKLLGETESQEVEKQEEEEKEEQEKIDLNEIVEDNNNNNNNVLNKFFYDKVITYVKRIDSQEENLMDELKDNVIDRVESLNRRLDSLEKDVDSVVHSLNSATSSFGYGFKTHSSELIELEDMAMDVRGFLTRKVEDVRKEQRLLKKTLKSKTETSEGNGFNLWIVFVLFQCLAFGVYVTWKKFSDDSKKYF